ncbi:hypothetical protein Y888_06150 [Mixta calida B021323]|nr:hypothetical protein Y888_06150 [Mixta calida B021323]
MQREKGRAATFFRLKVGGKIKNILKVSRLMGET